MSGQKLFHIGITKEQGAEYAILTGDPGRVEKITAFLDAPAPLGHNREFTSFCGKLRGKRVIVMSTGIGGPSAAIALEELTQAGLKTAIRIGTCGGIAPKVKADDLVIATAAVRMEGTSREYAPIEYPAAADYDVIAALVKSADALGYTSHRGVIHSKDSFYGQHCPERMPVSTELLEKWEAWKRLGVLASEMETAALYTAAAVLGVRMGCVLHVLWNQEIAAPGKDNNYAPDTENAVRTAVKAIEILIDSENDAK